MPTALPACPSEWEYDQIPGVDDTLRRRAMVILRWVRVRTEQEKQDAVRDTRRLHGLYFEGLTPPHFPYFAGRYRGERLRCLESYEVQIVGDPVVGHPAATVPLEMSSFQAIAMTSITNVRFTWGVNEAVFPRQEKLLRTVRVVAGLFVYFLEIHPYANGNGHMARFLCIALFGIFGLYPARWPVHPRPADPPYSDAIKMYRRNQREPLEKFLLSCL